MYAVIKKVNPQISVDKHNQGLFLAHTAFDENWITL